MELDDVIDSHRAPRLLVTGVDPKYVGCRISWDCIDRYPHFCLDDGTGVIIDCSDEVMWLWPDRVEDRDQIWDSMCNNYPPPFSRCVTLHKDDCWNDEEFLIVEHNVAMLRKCYMCGCEFVGPCDRKYSFVCNDAYCKAMSK